MDGLAKIDCMTGLISLTVMLTGLLIPGPALSQDVAVGAATVEVLEAVTISSSQALDFGSILQGVPSKILNNDGSSAGIFEISGANGAGVEAYLLLPSYLTRKGGEDRLSVVFGTTDISVDTTGAGDPAGMDASKGWQNTDPNNLPANIKVGSADTDLYLGGSAIPSPTQKPGDYSGEIVLTVYYTGM